MPTKTNKKLFYNFRVFLFPYLKRAIDLLGAIVLLIIFSPIIIPASIAIKLGSKGPIFFKQIRVGKDSKPFYLYKFRTMYIGDNDARLKQFPELYKKYIKNDWKLPLKEDPRVTPVGRFLRMVSLDEFPQIINILKGEMSLVGPRAYREEELEDYASRYPHTREYIKDIRSAKPGLTGLWQTSGRNKLNFEERARLDSLYVRNRSIFQEILIILKTPFCMLSIW